MSEQIKRYDMKYDHDAMEYEMAEDAAGDYVTFHSHDMALAAKEARIAELEKRMRPMPPSNFDLTEQEQFIRRRADEIFDENQADEQADDYMYMNEKMCREAAAIEWGAMQAVAAQQPAEPATPSEDGLEVPAVVAYLPTDAERGIGDDRRGGPAIWYGKPPAGNKLMTVAQHERIVAAKDAEIARLKSDNEKRATMDRYCMVQRRLREQAEEAFKFEKECREEVEMELNELRALVGAQPARQVGGGDLPPLPWPEMPHGSIDYFSAAQMRSYARQASAALAPAAVVMPDAFTVALKIREAMDRQACPDAWMRIAVEAAEKVMGEEFTRLNRRAIPAGLILRALQVPIGPAEFADREAAQNELRALLGKEGE